MYLMKKCMDLKLFTCNCAELKDVSNLGYVEELALFDCDKVKDVSTLGKVRIPRLSLEGLNALSNVHELYLEWCTISDLSPLANIHKLFLRGITHLKQVK